MEERFYEMANYAEKLYLEKYSQEDEHRTMFIRCGYWIFLYNKFSNYLDSDIIIEKLASSKLYFDQYQFVINFYNAQEPKLDTTIEITEFIRKLLSELFRENSVSNETTLKIIIDILVTFEELAQLDNKQQLDKYYEA